MKITLRAGIILEGFLLLLISLKSRTRMVDYIIRFFAIFPLTSYYMSALTGSYLELLKEKSNLIAIKQINKFPCICSN